MKQLLIRLIVGGSIITVLSQAEPLKMFDYIFPYKKLEKLTHDIIREPWPSPDLFSDRDW